MRNVILFAVAVSIASCADGRVYYVENLDGGRNNDAIYPIVEQQASRDLDLAFSAGDTVENENVVSPTRKVSDIKNYKLEKFYSKSKFIYFRFLLFR